MPALAHALRLSELAALEVDRIVTGVAAMMAAVSNAPMVQNGTPDCRPYLDRLDMLLPQVLLINVTDADGVSICSSSDAPGKA